MLHGYSNRPWTRFVGSAPHWCTLQKYCIFGLYRQSASRAMAEVSATPSSAASNSMKCMPLVARDFPRVSTYLLNVWVNESRRPTSSRVSLCRLQTFFFAQKQPRSEAESMPESGIRLGTSCNRTCYLPQVVTRDVATPTPELQRNRAKRHRNYECTQNELTGDGPPQSLLEQSEPEGGKTQCDTTGDEAPGMHQRG